MIKRFFLLIVILESICFIHAAEQNTTIKVYHTTDIHGNFFPFDFINNRPNQGSLARVSSFVQQQRSIYGENVLLLDGGDILQGQPAVYYSNFIDTTSVHLCSEIMNYLKYDVAVVGNHDIETGHAVYDRWIRDCDFPVLGANVVNQDGTPYLPAYAVFEKEEVKVAVLGMITQAIPAWLPENLWSGLKFLDIEETANKFIPLIKESEQPDIIIGLFHTGVKTSEVAGFKESVGLEVAQSVPGFDVIFCGHDHSPFSQKFANQQGDSVLVINPGAGGNMISDVTIHVTKENGKVIDKKISGNLELIAEIEPDPVYLEYFSNAYNKTKEFVDAEIGEFTHTISARDAWFGPSAFVDLLHTLQLNLTKADISLVAPLSLDAVINSGKIYMRDMFNLYRYENLLYTMNLTGKEIKDALEFCYGLWTNQMNSVEDHLLLIKLDSRTDKYHFVNPYYMFDSAAGINYTVDVTKPVGERIHVESMADGKPFNEHTIYRVAVNSYQGSGGGSILTDGSGIQREKLHERIIFSTDKDLRFYLAEEIKKQKVLNPQPLDQWRFIPQEWVESAAKRDYKLLFGE